MSNGLDPKDRYQDMNAQKNYLLIGSGRLARHLRHYLSQQPISLRFWSRGIDQDFNSVSVREFPDEADRFRMTIDDVQVVLLAISDPALPGWVNRPEFRGKTIIHFAGSRHYPPAWGFHPLMTFAPTLYPIDTYRRIPFVAEQGFPRDEVFPFLENPVFEINPTQKPLYHALCHMAANFPALLWVKIFNRFESDLKLPAELLRPMIEKILENTLASREKSLAGPLVRDDYATLNLHQQALQSDPQLEEIYTQWTEWAKHLKEQQR